MKAILLSIKPKYVADILNGKKTIEIRKTMPKCDLPIDVYIYCTKNRLGLYWANKWVAIPQMPTVPSVRNGKVVAKFTLRKVEAIDIWQEDLEEKMKLACLSIKEFDDYSKGQVAYAWHIEDLVIFDEPKELSEFWTTSHKVKGKKGHYTSHQISKAPQSYCFINGEIAK